jgi:pimeloyl-ACP methyl ester carboxylesterase
MSTVEAVQALGAVRTVELSAGTVEVRDTGGQGPVVVLIGGLAIGPSLWRGVVEDLRADHRCVVPTLPWGAHRLPMRPGADLTLRGHARLVAELLGALDLRDVVLVENDTGMAQLVAADHPERLGGLVLTSCEAFDNYPPGLAGKAVGVLGRLPGGVFLAMQQLRLRPLRRSPLTYGWMSHRPIPDAELDAWLRPLQRDRAIRRDLEAYLRHLDRRVLVEAAERLRGFDRPALVAWAADDRLMPVEHGRRLAALLPQGRFVLVPDSRTLIPLDQPRVLAGLVRDLAAAAQARSSSPTP